MTPSRVTIVTLGVRDLARSTAFYTRVFGVTPPPHEGISFFHLPGTVVALYPLDRLAKDIGPDVTVPKPGTFSGITLAHNARSKADVLAIFEHLRAVGATIVKPPQDVFWGGFSGYFSDPDGYYWEVAWAPGSEFAADAM